MASYCPSDKICVVFIRNMCKFLYETECKCKGKILLNIEKACNFTFILKWIVDQINYGYGNPPVLYTTRKMVIGGIVFYGVQKFLYAMAT
jgi:hypothetical protein